MEMNNALACFAALSQPTRLEAFRLLVQAEPDGLAAGELARRLDTPQNTLSTHLSILTRCGLARGDRRGRSVVYRASVAQLRGLTDFLAKDCCGGAPQRCAPDAQTERVPRMTDDRTYNVLFLCTGNSARSILAEALLGCIGGARFRAFSAGSQPKGAVHPMALKILGDGNFPLKEFRSKSWEEFSGEGAPKMDFIFTVCDSAAGEACPVWPGQPMTAHWGIDDPAAATGAPIEIERAFVQAFNYLKRRIELFTALPIDKLDRLTLHAKIKAIGAEAGATARAGR
jgi:ArsR family transcriptional regulator, arsenate/arsenite/antimonite-responsive transcriptional repressor / arsenate reductase (thioredoxin)